MYNGLRRNRRFSYNYPKSTRRYSSNSRSYTRRRRYVSSRPGSTAYRYRNRFVARTVGNPLSNSERKYFDTAATQTLEYIDVNWNNSNLTMSSLTGTGLSTLKGLFVPAAGTSYTQRVGRQVKLLSLRIRGSLTFDPQTNVDPNTIIGVNCRLILVQDKQCNGTDPTPQNVLQNFAGSSGTGLDAFQEPQNIGRYVLLSDKIYSLSPPAVAGTTSAVDSLGQTKFFFMNVNFKTPLLVHFNSGSTESVANLVDHNFFIMAGAQTSTNNVSISVRCRAIFIDP